MQFAAAYDYQHVQAESGELSVRFAFPDPSAVYDGFRFLVNGRDFAGAVEAETGSILSHLAILAREFGVPTVVGVENAVGRFPAGTTVVVDGSTGEVTPA